MNRRVEFSNHREREGKEQKFYSQSNDLYDEPSGVLRILSSVLSSWDRLGRRTRTFRSSHGADKSPRTAMVTMDAIAQDMAEPAIAKPA